MGDNAGSEKARKRKSHPGALWTRSRLLLLFLGVWTRVGVGSAGRQQPMLNLDFLKPRCAATATATHSTRYVLESIVVNRGKPRSLALHRHGSNGALKRPRTDGRQRKRGPSWLLHELQIQLLASFFAKVAKLVGGYAGGA